MYIYTTDYLHEEYMCNKTWLMFYCRRDEHDNTLILGKVLVHSEDCKRSFFLQAVHIYTKSAVTKNQ